MMLPRVLICVFITLVSLACVSAYTAPSADNIVMSLGLPSDAPDYTNIIMSLGSFEGAVPVEDTVNVSWTDLPPGNLSFHNLTVDFSYVVNYTNSSDIPVCEFYNATDTLLATNSTPPNNTVSTFTQVISGLELTDSFYISCADSITNESTTRKNITLDDTKPRRPTYNPLNGTSFNSTAVITVNVTFSDSSLKRLELNITDSLGVLRYHLLNTSLSGPSGFEQNITVNLSGWASGVATFLSVVSDGNSTTTFNTLSNITFFTIACSFNNDAMGVVFHANLTNTTELDQNFMPNMSLILDQVNFSDNATLIGGNFSWNLTEYNISANTTWVLNFSNNASQNMTVQVVINGTIPDMVEVIFWPNETGFVNLSDSVINNLFTLVPDASRLINVTINLLNASQSYENWTLAADRTDFGFNISFNATCA